MDQEVGPTRNPVFDFRAGFRRAAGALQRWLLVAGTGVLLLSLIWLAVGDPAVFSLTATLWGVGAGAGLALLGLIWGYAWRRLLRSAFHREYGPGH